MSEHAVLRCVQSVLKVLCYNATSRVKYVIMAVTQGICMLQCASQAQFIHDTNSIAHIAYLAVLTPQKQLAETVVTKSTHMLIEAFALKCMLLRIA